MRLRNLDYSMMITQAVFPLCSVHAQHATQRTVLPQCCSHHRVGHISGPHKSNKDLLASLACRFRLSCTLKEQPSQEEQPHASKGSQLLMAAELIPPSLRLQSASRCSYRVCNPVSTSNAIWLVVPLFCNAFFLQPLALRWCRQHFGWPFDAF